MIAASAPVLLFLAALFGMELFANLVHRHVMHGWGWGWHASHHSPRTGWFERNDRYAVLAALPSVGLMHLGVQHGVSWALPVGLGMASYGALYFVMHDLLVHQRIKLKWMPQSGYLRRLIQGHRIHHATHTRDGAVGFGFLYSPTPEALAARLRALRSHPPRGEVLRSQS